MAGSMWSRLQILCPLFNYCQVKPADCDTSQHFPDGPAYLLDSPRVPPDGDGSFSCCVHRLPQGHAMGQSPTPPALPSRLYGIHSLALNTSYHLVFAHCFCKLSNLFGTTKELSTTFLCSPRKHCTPCSRSVTGHRLIRTPGPQGPAPTAQNPAIHSDSHAQPPSSPLSTCSHVPLRLPPPP